MWYYNYKADARQCLCSKMYTSEILSGFWRNRVMYNGTNPSALRSREWLCNALLEMLKSQRFTEITIKDICREADLSRQTFYQIFESKEEIIAYHFEELFSAFRVSCANFDGITLTELTRKFFSFFEQHASNTRILFKY